MQGHDRPLADIDPTRTVQHARDQRRYCHALKSRANSIQDLNGKHPPTLDGVRRDHSPDRKGCIGVSGAASVWKKERSWSARLLAELHKTGYVLPIDQHMTTEERGRPAMLYTVCGAALLAFGTDESWDGQDTLNSSGTDPSFLSAQAVLPRRW